MATDAEMKEVNARFEALLNQRNEALDKNVMYAARVKMMQENLDTSAAALVKGADALELAQKNVKDLTTLCDSLQKQVEDANGTAELPPELKTVDALYSEEEE